MKRLVRNWPKKAVSEVATCKCVLKVLTSTIIDTMGHEQTGQRPALVLGVCPETSLAIVVPFTKNLDASRFPYSYEIKRTASNGLSYDSVALIYQTRSLTFTRFLRPLGNLEKVHCDRIKKLLKDYLQL